MCRSDGYRRGDYEYAAATVRLVEVEIYGYEREEADESAEIDSPMEIRSSSACVCENDMANTKVKESKNLLAIYRASGSYKPISCATGLDPRN